MKLSGLAAASVLAALLLSGCNGDPEPEFADPKDSPSSRSAAASPTEPLSPREEERAFIREYWEAVEADAQVGDPSGFMSLSAADCESCRAYARNIRNAYRNGGHVEGVEWSVTKAKFVRTVRGRSVWSVELDSEKQLWFDGSNAIVKTIPKGTDFFQMELSGHGTQIHVADFAFVEP